MKKYILDTNALLWLFKGDVRAQRILECDTSGEVHCSVINFWEISIKQKIGKLVLPSEENLEGLIKSCENTFFSILDVKPEHIIELENLDMIHKDPFDRLLISQARVGNMYIISGDKIFGLYTKKFIQI